MKYSFKLPFLTLFALFIIVISCSQDIAGTTDNAIQSAAVTSAVNIAEGVSCPPGTFSEDGLTPCQPCSSGSYQDETGQTSCKLAEPGSFVSFEGAVFAELCPLGTYQDEAGQSSCKVAEPGSFVDFVGASASILCPVGTFTDVPGSAACTLCPYGTTTVGPGATACILINDPLTKDDCKKGGWEVYGFKNQGQCVRFIETGIDSR
jgi:hypothetical protein